MAAGKSGRVAEKNPDTEQARAALERAREHIRAGAEREAGEILNALVRSEPDYFAAWFLLGTLLFQRADWWGAVACFNRASMLNPANVQALINLGLTYTRLGAADWAEAVLRLALGRDPDNAKVLRLIAEICHATGDYDQAVELLERANALQPASFETLQDLATVEFERGNLDDAGRCWREALECEKSANPHSPRLAKIYHALAMLPGDSDRQHLLGEISLLEKQQDTGWSEKDRLTLRFGKSYALSRAGKYAASWRELEGANAAVWKTVAGKAQEELEALRSALAEARAFNAERIFLASVSNRTVPVFIVGASRSGKTTLERLLASLDTVHRGYESNIVSHAVARTAHEAGLPKIDDIRQLPSSLYTSFSDIFAAELAKRARGARLLTITSPGGAQYAGQLARAIRNAVFIFVRRSTNDNALRCLQKQYEKANYYSYNLAACREYITLYNELIEVWNEKLASRSRLLNYEDLVTEPARALESLTKILPLEVPPGEQFPVGDDSGCAKPFARYMRMTETGRRN